MSRGPPVWCSWMKPRSQDRERSFTLVELLVVVAILMALAAMLLPALKQARQKAKQAHCVSNLHQIGMAVILYLDDQAGRLPFVPWNAQYEQFARLRPYIANERFFTCPSAQPGDSGATWPTYYCIPTNLTVCSDYKFNDHPSITGNHLHALRDPNWVVVALDFDWGPDRHFGGNNLLFADGHVEWFANAKYKWPAPDPYGNQGWFNWGL